jgi:hypothetical protein
MNVNKPGGLVITSGRQWCFNSTYNHICSNETRRYEVFRRALPFHLPLFQKDSLITMRYSELSVIRGQDTGPALHERTLDRVEDDVPPRLRVHGAETVVQNDVTSSTVQRSCQCQYLLLTPGQATALFTRHC